MRKLLEPSLYFFSVVAQSGSLTAATEKLGLTVSALSRHIAKLEGDVGVPLFERRTRGMVLSHAGRVLLRHVHQSLADAEAVMGEIQGIERKRTRIIRIACSEGFAFDFLPVSLGGFYAKHKDASVELEVVPSKIASQMVLSGEVSIALSFSFEPEPGLFVRLTLPAPIMALMRRDHQLANRTTIQLADLAQFPVLLQDQGMKGRQLFDLACDVEGVEIVPSVSSRYVAALYRFAQTVPDAILPSGYIPVAKRLMGDDMIALPFANPLLQQRRLYVKTLAGRSLDGLAQECLSWIVADLESTAEALFGL